MGEDSLWNTSSGEYFRFHDRAVEAFPLQLARADAVGKQINGDRSIIMFTIQEAGARDSGAQANRP